MWTKACCACRAVSQVASTGKLKRTGIRGLRTKDEAAPVSPQEKKRRYNKHAAHLHLVRFEWLTVRRTSYRVWGTPMPYVSKFSGRSLASVLPDDKSKRRPSSKVARSLVSDSRASTAKSAHKVGRTLVCGGSAEPSYDHARHRCSRAV